MARSPTSSRISKTTNPGSVGKIEQTSQTYGQYIEEVKSEVGISNKTTSRLSNAATDTIVHLVRGDNTSQKTSLSAADKASIALAAVSSKPTPTVAINIEESNKGSRGGIVAGDVDLARNFSSNFSDIVQSTPGNTVIVAGSNYLEPQKVKEILTEAKKIDLMFTLKSKDSEVLEFNNLKEVQFAESKFVYNFFNNFEADVESQEDPSQDSYLKSDLFNVPRYVKLSWTPTKITELLNQEEIGSIVENEEMKRKVFQEPRDNGDKMPPIHRDGRKLELVDMHQLEQAFDSTSNRKVFGNTILATLHTPKSKNVVNDIPIQRRNLTSAVLRDEQVPNGERGSNTRSSPGRGDL